MKKNNITRLVFTALFAALTCAATLVIHIPSPLNGYVNLGDCIVLVAGWLSGPFYGFLAGGIGSALADLLLGFAVYSPVTLVVKGTQAAVACLMVRALHKLKFKTVTYLISGIVAQAVMVGGYFIYESVLYGMHAAALNTLPNIVQSVVGITAAILIISVTDKTGIANKLRINK